VTPDDRDGAHDEARRWVVGSAPPSAHRLDRLVGVTPQETGFSDNLTVWEAVDLVPFPDP
jgi:ABC-type multidrug transport system ATPase subunit